MMNDRTSPSSTRQRPGRPTTTYSTAELSSTEMAAEVAAGNAVSLSERITDFIRFRSQWWILDQDGWFQADDEELIASLNAAALLMAQADRKVDSKP